MREEGRAERGGKNVYSTEQVQYMERETDSMHSPGNQTYGYTSVLNTARGQVAGENFLAHGQKQVNKLVPKDDA